MAISAPVPAKPAQPTFAGRFEFDDFDAIQEIAPDWDQIHHQIGRGRSRARISISQTGRMTLAAVSRSPGILTSGTPPAGMTVFSINLQGSGLHGQRIPWERHLVGVNPPGREFEFLAPGPSTLIAIAIEQGRLDEEAFARSGELFPAAKEASLAFRFRDDSSRRAVVGACSSWLAVTHRRPEVLLDPATAARMEEEIIGAVLEHVAPQSIVQQPRPYRQLALRVESVIRRSLEEPLLVEDLCRATGASARAVHASFQQVYRMSPKAYWKALRLAAARDDLQHATRATTVAGVAAKWGFFRFGYFSVDYRNTFGENPSMTLRRVTGRAAPEERVPLRAPPAR